MEYQYHTFPNGMRLVYRQTSDKISHYSVTVMVGSRNEPPEIHGMAHFIEHMLFKGTEKRKSYHILTYLDKVGGELNAYTAKEETCLYASFLSTYINRAIELIFDILFHPSFPQKEIEKEREVVIDEINSYLDAPAELIFDEFDQLLFDGHPLGGNILGQPDMIRSFSRQQLQDFVLSHYIPENMVISYLGDIEMKSLIRKIMPYMEERPLLPMVSQPVLPNYHALHKTTQRNSFQTHCIIGNRSFHFKHPLKQSFSFLNNLLGGPAMNSRLNLNIREKYGFCYHLESSYTPYSDTGVFSIYIGTDITHIEKTKQLVYRELEKLCTQRLTPFQLHAAKKQLIGQIALMAESRLAENLAMGKNMVVLGYAESLHEVLKKTDEITSSQLLESANLVFDKQLMSELVYLPAKEI